MRLTPTRPGARGGVHPEGRGEGGVGGLGVQRGGGGFTALKKPACASAPHLVAKPSTAWMDTCNDDEKNLSLINV